MSSHRQPASGDIEVAELQPGALLLNQVGPDHSDGLRVLGGEFEPNEGIVPVHGVAAHDG
jgi:hypothetical protein